MLKDFRASTQNDRIMYEIYTELKQIRELLEVKPIEPLPTKATEPEVIIVPKVVRKRGVKNGTDK